jgi:hypothetical protein
VILKHQASSNIDAVEALGVQLAEKLIEMGGLVNFARDLT